MILYLNTQIQAPRGHCQGNHLTDFIENIQKCQKGCFLSNTHTHTHTHTHTCRNPQFLSQELRSGRWLPGHSHRLRGSALPDKLRRVVCTAPPASAGCTNCIPCLETWQRQAAGLAGAREEQHSQHAGMKVSSESLRCQVLRRCRLAVLLEAANNSAPFHAPLLSLTAARTHAHRHTDTHSSARAHTHHSLLWVILAAGLWSNAHAIYTATHAY